MHNHQAVQKKKETSEGALGLSFKSPSSYAMGALALAGLGMAAYQVKKNGGLILKSSTAGTPLSKPVPQTGLQTPQSLNTANLYGS